MKPAALFLADPTEAADVYGPEQWAALSDRVKWVLPRASPATTLAQLADASATEYIFSSWGMPVADPAFLAHLPRLRAIFHAAGSIKSFATAALWSRGVRVTCAAAINAIPVAEFCLAQIIFCLKRGWPHVQAVRQTRAFNKRDPLMRGAYHSTVGLISLGHTGQLLTRLLKCLDVQLIAYDPLIDPNVAAHHGVELVGLEELFARSDVVSCHTPLLPATRRMLRAHHFERMPAGASFINTARGGVVHEAELIHVLRQRPDLTAVLDVTDPEPPAKDSAFYELPNVVLTPHIAGSLGQECRRLGQMMIEEFDRLQRGEPLLGEQTPARLAVTA